jgi:hypothetical protein
MSLTSLASYAHLQEVNEGHWIDPDGWLQGPRALAQPIPEARTQTVIVPRSVIHHTNAAPHYTRWQALISYWRRTDIGIEAHSQIDRDGLFVQAIPMTRRADCNARANQWTGPDGRTYGALSWETADDGSGTLQTTPWTVEQLATIIAADTAACVTYGIACTDGAKWTDSGLFAHNRFPEFSVYKGKTCPGRARTAQLDYVRHEVAVRVMEFHRRNGTSCPGVS